MNLKRQAAEYALTQVESGMVLGLGSGSTTMIFVELLGEEIQRGRFDGILGVPTSEGTAELARSVGISLVSLDELGHAQGVPLHLVVDGADEVDPDLNLIKGLGRALLREKVVEVHAQRFLVIVDETKLVPRLGTKCPLPLEVLPFGVLSNLRWLNTLGCRAELVREADDDLAVTDNGNYLVHCHFQDGIANPHKMARALADRPGIIEHGLFLGMASAVVVAGADGMRVLER